MGLEALMATKNQIRGGLRRKQKAGLLPPQKCPNAKCGVDLSDPNVPEEYAQYATMFGLAREVPIDAQTAAWQCPACLTVFDKHRRPADLQ